MKKLAFLFIAVVLLFGAVSSISAEGIDDPNGVPLYVIIEVDWDGTDDYGDWTVWGPVWDPVLGDTLLTSCTDCLEMNYDFKFRGKTVQFDEVMVPNVVATPQAHHVVLFDKDGDGTYTGSLSASHYFPWVEGSAILYFDRLDYEVTFDANGNLTHFYYVQYEHKKVK